MTPEHPITPTPELTDVWKNLPLSDEEIFVIAARWGADQELEACCEWLRSKDTLEPAIEALRAVRRPKPPSLAEQAIAELQSHRTELRSLGRGFCSPAINAALERLQQLEQENND